MGFLEIFEGCPGNIGTLSLRFYMGVEEIFDGCLGNIVGSPGNILWVSCRYLTCVLENFLDVLEISDGFH